MHADIGERTTLCGNDATLLERAKEKLKVWLLKQRLCWAFWVRGVGDNDIKLILIIIQEFKSISNVDLYLGVLEADSHAWEVLLRQSNHSLIW
jgi:hypothetical protein